LKLVIVLILDVKDLNSYKGIGDVKDVGNPGTGEFAKYSIILLVFLSFIIIATKYKFNSINKI
jgi:hypothetical protein